MPVVKLLNFFIKFRESCKGKNGKHRLIDIIQEVFECDNEDEVFSIYPLLLNQVKFAFVYLSQNTKHDTTVLANIKNTLEIAINLSRGKLYQTLSECNQDPKNYPIYLDQTTFILFQAFAQGLGMDDENIAKEDVDALIKDILDLMKSIEEKTISFGDKLYLQNLLKRIILSLKNYDKLSLSDDLSGDLVSLCYNVSLNDDLKEDEHILNKVRNVFGVVRNKIKPHKLQLGFKVKIPLFLEASLGAEWNNKVLAIEEK